MGLNDRKDDGGWVSKNSPSGAIPPQPKEMDETPVIDEQMKRRLVKVFQIWAIYTVFSTCLIIFTPTSWTSLTPITAITNQIADKIPYLAYLASISDSPEIIKFCYATAWILSLVHGLLAICTTIMNYKAGYITDKILKKAALFSWTVPVFVWALYFTCFACRVPPGRHELFAISNRLVMAFLGQVFVYASSLCVAILILWIFRIISPHKVPDLRKGGQ